MIMQNDFEINEWVIIIGHSHLMLQAIFTLYWTDFRSGSEIDPVQCETMLKESEPDWNGLELSCIDLDFIALNGNVIASTSHVPMETKTIKTY